MAADDMGSRSFSGAWGTLKQIRDLFVLIAFMAMVLFWGRDIWEQHADLPTRVAAQSAEIDDMRDEVAVLMDPETKKAVIGAPGLRIPDGRHRIENGRPGEIVTVLLDPVHWDRDDCVSQELRAFMVDHFGRWHSVETGLLRLPSLSGTGALAFGVRIHPRMAVGRAEFLVEVVQQCGMHRQVHATPRLSFQVLPFGAWRPAL